jgi:hypothetical protein
MPGLLDAQDLLSPQEEGFARSQGFANLAAALMKGARWSNVPVSPFETMGDALNGYTQGYNGAADQLMKRELLRSQVDQKRLTAIQAIAQYAGLGIKPPPFLVKMAGGADAIGNFGNLDAGGGAPAPAAGSPQGAPPVAGPGAPPPVQAGAPPAVAPGPQAGAGMPPGLLGGPSAIAPIGAPQAPGVGAIPDVGNILRQLPLSTRYSLAVKGPAGEIAKDLISKSLAPTDLQKNATASNTANPLDFETKLATAKANAEAAAKNAELSPDMKAARDAGYVDANGKVDLPGYQQAIEHNKVMTEHVNGYIKGYDAERQSVDTLNQMEDAIKSGGDKLMTGPLSPHWLKIKQIAGGFGIQTEGVPQAEVITKLNAILASTATKDISSRPAVFEFQKMMENNPGLMNSTEGTLKLIDFLRQQKTRSMGLAKLAMNKDNLKNWSTVEDDYLRKHPVVSPFSGLPMGTDFKGQPGWKFSRSRMQWQDPQSGKLYDVTGAPVQ